MNALVDVLSSTVMVVVGIVTAVLIASLWIILWIEERRRPWPREQHKSFFQGNR